MFSEREHAFRAQLARESRYREMAQQIVTRMHTEALVAQVLMTGVAGRDSLSPEMKKLLSEIPVGAIMLFKYNIADSPRGVYTFIAECTTTAAQPLPEQVDTSTPSTAGTSTVAEINRLLPFVAIDHEGGDVYRLGQVATHMPPASRYLSVSLEIAGRGTTRGPSQQNTAGRPRSAGSIASTAHLGSTTDSRLAIHDDTWFTIRQAAYLSGRELRSLGITMNLAPVAEPLAPENRDFLQNRSFAADPTAVAAAAAAFIQGMGEAGVTCVVKHFPLSAAADPHHGTSVLTIDKQGLSNLVAPFEALLKNRKHIIDLETLYPKSLITLPIQPGGVMVAHTIVTPIDEKFPASLSNRVLHSWIRESLGFSGIVLTDDFAMKAITDAGYTVEGAIIHALKAGSDMVMVWPRDLRRIHRILVEQAKSDTLFRERLVDAASRIITLKLLQGLMESPTAFNDEGYDCMRKATEQFLRERNLR
ncbi:glycoside hydrolase family 3 N-terminal domain-containing protein [Gracilinema caldarium]|uniref:glycoside hydrolase family 3 N-terminal domain-containing protein n=1 Tax=Gracilinema caldarium TaxID=215591 RepID=UPI00031743EE|nr:glycoside hydrolase family 3 N-terminal domain-containing protein [Gracilinema caldarium]